MTIDVSGIDPTLGWPSGRGHKTALMAQFGAERANLAHWALVTADPLADAVAADMEGGHPETRAAFHQGVRQGLSALEHPPESVRALLADAERRPDYVDDDLLDHGSAPFFTSPLPVHIVSLSAGALIRVYESPSIAAVLTSTGRLVDGADRRLQETGKWLQTIMRPGALRVGQPGYVATLQVRLLHANMRRLVRSRGYDEARHGAPINQIDLARTWMDFTVTSFRAEEAMGFGLTTGEAATIYRYWWRVGHLLGIDARLIEGVSSNEQASRVDELLQAVTGPLVAESAALAEATLGSVAGALRTILNVPGWLGSRALNSLARRFHGDPISDELRIKSYPAMDKIVGLAAATIRRRRMAARQDPAAWRQIQVRSLAATEAGGAAGDQAQYEQAAAGAAA